MRGGLRLIGKRWRSWSSRDGCMCAGERRTCRRRSRRVWLCRSSVGGLTSRWRYAHNPKHHQGKHTLTNLPLAHRTRPPPPRRRRPPLPHPHPPLHQFRLSHLLLRHRRRLLSPRRNRNRLLYRLPIHPFPPLHAQPTHHPPHLLPPQTLRPSAIHTLPERSRTPPRRSACVLAGGVQGVDG